MTEATNDILLGFANSNRIPVYRGVLDAYRHVSVRDPDTPDRFLLSRSLTLTTLSRSDIQVHDLDGHADDDRPGYLGWLIHGSFDGVRDDVSHSHSASMADRQLRAVRNMEAFLGSGVLAFDVSRHEGDSSDLLIGTAQRGRHLAEDLGVHAVVLMRGHGAVTVGYSLSPAVHHAVFAERSAQVQLHAVALRAVRYATEGESAAAAAANDGQRAWDVWRRAVGLDIDGWALAILP